MRCADVPAWRWCTRVLAGGSCLAATAGWTRAAAPPLLDHLQVSPTSVTQGALTPFVLNFTSTVNFRGGSVTLTVPSGWPVPVLAPAGSQNNGDVSCAAGECAAPPTISGQNITLQPAQNITPAVTVDYYATVPTGAPDAIFTAVMAPTPAAGPIATSSATVTMTPSPVVAPTSPSTVTATVTATPSTVMASTPASSVSSTPTIGHVTSEPGTPSFTSTATPQPARDPVLSLPVALGITSGFALLLVAGWRQHHRPAPGPGSSVRAVPRAGPPPRLSVRTTGREPTRTVRIEPHPGTTTIEETSRDNR